MISLRQLILISPFEKSWRENYLAALPQLSSDEQDALTYVIWTVLDFDYYYKRKIKKRQYMSIFMEWTVYLPAGEYTEGLIDDLKQHFLEEGEEKWSKELIDRLSARFVWRISRRRTRK